MTSKLNTNKALAVLTLASTLGIVSAAQAQAPAYDALHSTIGSAGLIDSGSTASPKTIRAILTMGSGGTLIARYPVPPSVELDTDGGFLHLVANLFDPGLGASVSVSLIEVAVGKPGENPAAQTSKAVLTVKSSDDPISTFANPCVNDGGDVKLDFESNVYFIQAVLNWDAATQPRAPQLRAIQLVKYVNTMCGGQ